jgi:hypothetical protein
MRELFIAIWQILEPANHGVSAVAGGRSGRFAHRAANFKVF